MSSEVKVRVSKKNTIYIPKAIADAAGIKEGSYVRLKAEKFRIIIQPVINPFELALKGPKYAKTSFEEFEKGSEELQHEILT